MARAGGKRSNLRTQSTLSTKRVLFLHPPNLEKSLSEAVVRWGPSVLESLIAENCPETKGKICRFSVSQKKITYRDSSTLRCVCHGNIKGLEG